MPAPFNGNDALVNIDGVSVRAIWRNITITPGGAQIDSTSGAGSTDMTRVPGLNDHSITIECVYDADTVETDLPLFQQNITRTVEWGPENGAAGTLKHEQKFIFQGPPITQDVTKSLVVLSTSGVAAEAPTSNMFAGDTY